jgi:hypothetical protein
MNPALPPLAAVTILAAIAALFAWRARGARARELTLAFALCSALALVPLAPHLALADGVPSGASLLRSLVPWRSATVEAGALTVNPEQNDLPYQVEPRLRFVRGELRSGRLPFWNPLAFGGYPLWSAAQAAPLSPATWIFAALPLELAFFALPYVRFLAAALGAFLLARELGLDRPAAFLAAATFAFSGRFVSFALYPLDTAVALIPWVLLATERVARAGHAGRGAPLLAVAAALQWTSGHPETAAFTLAGSLLWLLLAARTDARPFLRWCAGTAVGLFLAAAALVPFALLLPGISRVRAAAATPLALADLGAVLLRFLLPEAFGNPLDGSAFGGLPYVATLVYCGAFAIPLAAVGLASISGARRDERVPRLAIFGAVTLLVALAPRGVHDLLLIVPGLRHGIAHYYLPLALVALALLAGIGLEKLGGAGRGALAGTAVAAAATAALAWFALGERWIEHGLLARNLGRAALVVGAPIALLALRRPTARRSWLPPAIALAAAAELALTHSGEIPLSRTRDLYRDTPAIAALRAAGGGRLLASRWTLPPNTATPFDIADLRGADAVTPVRLADALGPLLAGELREDEPGSYASAQRSRKLDAWAVHFWMTPPGDPPPEAATRLLYEGADARLYGRTNARSVVHFEDANFDAEDHLGVVERRPGFWAIEWNARGKRTIAVADSFDGGWRATIDGRPAAIDGSDPLLLRVAAGPGSGRLELRYRPPGLAVGAFLSLAGLVALAALLRGEKTYPDMSCLAVEAAGTIRADS